MSVAITQTMRIQYHDQKNQTNAIQLMNKESQVKITPQTAEIGIQSGEPEEDLGLMGEYVYISTEQEDLVKRAPQSARASKSKNMIFGDEDEEEDKLMDFNSSPNQITDKERFQLDYFLKRDPLQEFFNLTCKSIILNSPHMNQICHVDMNYLYLQATKKHIPFNKWSEWIEEYMNKEFLKAVLNSKSKGSKGKEEGLRIKKSKTIGSKVVDKRTRSIDSRDPAMSRSERQVRTPTSKNKFSNIFSKAEKEEIQPKKSKIKKLFMLGRQK